MSEASRPLVSFIVPTLNRGRHVLRAVESCLQAETEIAGVDVEVIVLDSESDDGSWEALQERYGSDTRVVLAQNRRGLGPTRSWLDGARLVRGDYVTYLWSDDYISPQFLTVLVPPLQNGARLAVGRGLIRDLNDESPLPAEPGYVLVERETFIAGYFRRKLEDGVYRPVSPACSLFAREAFDEWMAVAEEWCQATPLRTELQWRRAIGPDLLLYLVAVYGMNGSVPMSRCVTAQFSHHPESISIAASTWSYGAGYWLAQLWYLRAASDAPAVPSALVDQLCGALCQGGILACLAPFQGTPKRLAASASIIDEIWRLWRVIRLSGRGCRVAVRAPKESLRLVARFCTSRVRRAISCS